MIGFLKALISAYRRSFKLLKVLHTHWRAVDVDTTNFSALALLNAVHGLNTFNNGLHIIAWMLAINGKDPFVTHFFKDRNLLADLILF